MMVLRPTSCNGRTAEGQTPYGRFRVEWDSTGKLVSESIEIRDPSPPAVPPAALTAEQIALAEQRAAICEGCDQSRGVRRVVKERQVYNVKCKGCGCGGLSLIRGQCPAGKWPGAQ